MKKIILTKESKIKNKIKKIRTKFKKQIKISRL
jgi:hypothetical protein